MDGPGEVSRSELQATVEARRELGAGYEPALIDGFLGPSEKLQILQVPYESPDVGLLVTRLQSEYVTRYGGPDDTPLTAAELRPPEGVFLVLRRAGAPLAMGGWRRHVQARSGWVPGRRAAEIKRMYVLPEARSLGLGRRVLAELERLAAADGCDQMVLETGLAQPEAIALYRSAGFHDIASFGHYVESPQSVHLGKPLTPAA